MGEIAEYVNQVVPRPVAMGYCSVDESDSIANRFSINWPVREVAVVEKVMISK